MSQHLFAPLTPVSYGRKLADMGIRPTVPRVRIATLLLAAPQHLSAEQIIAALAASGRRVSKATVYNTLKIFAASGLIRQLTIDDTRAWYDSNMGAHYHFHDAESGARAGGGVQPPAADAGWHGSRGHRSRYSLKKKTLESPRFAPAGEPRSHRCAPTRNVDFSRGAAGSKRPKSNVGLGHGHRHATAPVASTNVPP
jgi:Fur family iron response transcriptional regulator